MSIWDLDDEEFIEDVEETAEKNIKVKHELKGASHNNIDEDGLDEDESDTVLNKDKIHVEDFNYLMLDRFNKNDLSEHEYIAKDLGFNYIRIKDKQTKETIAKYVDKYNFNGETIRICPEPITFLHGYDSVSDSKKKANDKFREELKSFKTIDLNYTPTYEEKPMWINKTLNGINLRPGKFIGNEETFKPISMNDDGVHGLIVGRTGSGKSVFINQLILSLITEYSPWELDLYLADFKKVELSRYMNDSDEHNEYTMYTPHVKACAATSEIRYVISLMKNLVDRMNARNEFFTRLGITKIKDFRTTYNLVLPRVLLIVDEFQQLFTEASTREAEEIQFLLNSITKLGRATGFHLIFASQEMSGTLSGNTLANFKIRMALPCESGISRDILGNTAAAKLERNFILINTDSGDEIQNKKYHVPFIETEEKESDSETPKKTDFFTYLDNIKLCSKKYDLSYKTDTQKFYREELQEKEVEFIKDLDKVSKSKNKSVEENKNDLFDALVLGKTVLYTEKKNDKVTMYLEKGRNKGVLITSPDTSDIANIRRMMLENFKRSEPNITHVELNLNKMINAKYALKNHINETNYIDLDRTEFTAFLMWLRAARIKNMNINKKDDVIDGIHKFIANRNNLNKDKLEEKQNSLDEIEKKIAEFNSKSIMKNPVYNFIEKLARHEAFKGYKILNAEIYKGVLDKIKSNINTKDCIDKSLDCIREPVKRWKNDISKLGDKDENRNQIINNITLGNILATMLKIYEKEYYKNTDEIKMPPYMMDRMVLINNTLNELSNEINLQKEYEHKQKELEQLRIEKDTLIKEIDSIKKNIENNIVKVLIRQLTTDIYKQLNFETKLHLKLEEPSYEISNGEIKIICNNHESINDIIINELNMIMHNIIYNNIEFNKYIFWINGIDEIPEYEDMITKVIIDSINYDILVIANASSNLDSILLKRTFDYVFVTGRVEKMYSSYDIKYTKPALNSIVVNSIVRSKAMEIPFKIYKSNEDKINSYSFLDDLLD